MTTSIIMLGINRDGYFLCPRSCNKRLSLISFCSSVGVCDTILVTQEAIRGTNSTVPNLSATMSLFGWHPGKVACAKQLIQALDFVPWGQDRCLAAAA